MKIVYYQIDLMLLIRHWKAHLMSDLWKKKVPWVGLEPTKVLEVQWVGLAV